MCVCLCLVIYECVYGGFFKFVLLFMWIWLYNFLLLKFLKLLFYFNLIFNISLFVICYFSFLLFIFFFFVARVHPLWRQHTPVTGMMVLKRQKLLYKSFVNNARKQCPFRVQNSLQSHWIYLLRYVVYLVFKKFIFFLFFTQKHCRTCEQIHQQITNIALHLLTHCRACVCMCCWTCTFVQVL